MSVTNTLSDEQATALRAKAAVDGLTLEEWILKLGESRHPATGHFRHIAEVIAENMGDLPPEALAEMPTDGASQHDHYIYGWPKKAE